jgi:hypothetical protein
MPNTLSQSELKRLALLGAQARIEALRAEIETIVDNFPELGKGGAGVASGRGVKKTADGQGRRRNWNMSASQRRAVSARMKKYWAARRKEKAAKAGAKAPAKSA